MDYFDKIFGPGYGASKLTIDTRDFMDEAQKTRDYCKCFENSFAEYTQLLETVSRCGFMEGKGAEALRAYIEAISGLKKVMYRLGESYQRTVNEFLKEIDEADGFLYPRGYSGERVYTDAMFNKLTDITLCDFNARYTGRLNIKTNIVRRYTDQHKVCIKRMCSEISAYQAYSRSKLYTLKNNLRRIDSIYSQRLNKIKNQIQEFTRLLRKFIEVVDPQTGKVNLPKMIELKELVDLLEQSEIEIDETIVYERIRHLLAKIHIGEHYFGSPMWVIREYIRKYLRVQSIDRILYLRRHWIMLLRQGLIGEYTVPEATISVWKTEFTGIANAINIGETEDWWGDEATPITIQYFVDVVGRIPALGTSINEFLAMLEDMYIQIRTAEKIKQDIIDECEKEETPADFKDIIITNSNNSIIQWITELLPHKCINHDPNPFPSLIKKILVQALSDDWVESGSEGAASDEVMCAWSEECDGHLNDAVDAAQNTPADAAGYNGALESVASWIEQSRQSKISLFERMAKKASDKKKDYFNYCHDQLDTSTIFNCDFVEMMSLDEFLNVG